MPLRLRPEASWAGLALLNRSDSPALPAFLSFLSNFVILKLMKMLIYGSVLIFSTIGGYIPSLWHAGFLSLSGILGGIIGTIFGIWVAIKINNYVNI
jgi:hypothetical protein